MHTEVPAVCSDIHAKHMRTLRACVCVCVCVCPERRISERFNFLVHKVTSEA
jgi:hypothetical protein